MHTWLQIRKTSSHNKVPTIRYDKCSKIQTLVHSQESLDFRGLKLADTCQNPSIQVRLSLIFAINTDQIGLGFETDTPEK